MALLPQVLKHAQDLPLETAVQLMDTAVLHQPTVPLSLGVKPRLATVAPMAWPLVLMLAAGLGRHVKAAHSGTAVHQLGGVGVLMHIVVLAVKILLVLVVRDDKRTLVLLFYIVKIDEKEMVCSPMMDFAWENR